MDIFTGIFSAFGLSASAGLNAYIPLLVVAVIARFTDLIKLAEPWDSLTSGWVIILLIILSLIEFFTDKLPAVNHINDGIQTIIRPIAGAIVFAASASVITEINPILSLSAGLIVAGGVHVVKSVGVRPVVSATTAGAGNVPVSIAEDFISTTLSILAILIPFLLFLLMIPVVWWAFSGLIRRRKRLGAVH